MSSPGDWPEDFSHENGNYQNHCTTCGKAFMGHKRRVQCKACQEPDVFAEIEALLEDHSEARGLVNKPYKVSTCIRCRLRYPCDAFKALTGWKKAEERAQQAEAELGKMEANFAAFRETAAELDRDRHSKIEALAKKDEALREIIAVIQRTYGSDPSQRGVSKNRIERIAKGGLGE